MQTNILQTGIIGDPAVRIRLASVDALHLGLGRAQIVAELTDAHAGLAGRVFLTGVEQHTNTAPVADLVSFAIRVRLAWLASLHCCVGAETPIASFSRAALAVVAVLVGLALDLAGPDLWCVGRLRRFFLGLLALEVHDEVFEHLVGEGERALFHREHGGCSDLTFLTREVGTVKTNGRFRPIDARLTHGTVDPVGTVAVVGLVHAVRGGTHRVRAHAVARAGRDEGNEDGQRVELIHD